MEQRRVDYFLFYFIFFVKGKYLTSNLFKHLTFRGCTSSSERIKWWLLQYLEKQVAKDTFFHYLNSLNSYYYKKGTQNTTLFKSVWMMEREHKS